MLRCVVRKFGYLQKSTSLRNFVLKATTSRSLDPNPSLGASPGLIPDPSPSHSLAVDLEPGSELESEFVSNSGLESGVSCESMSYQDTDSYPVPDSDPDAWRFLCNSKASCFLLARPWHSVTSLSVIFQSAIVQTPKFCYCFPSFSGCAFSDRAFSVAPAVSRNNYDNVYGAVIMTKVIARVHTVHLMNVD